MPDKPGYMIHGEFLPFPDSFRLGDPVLVTEVTGMAFPEFAAALDDEDRVSDPVVSLGLIAVALWQKNPRWRRDRVARYVESLPIESVEFIEGDGGPEPVGADPTPAPVGADKSEPGQPNTNGQPDTSSDPSTQMSRGDPGSARSHPESDLVT